MNTFIFLTECISCDFQYNVEYEWWGGRNIVALFLISWGKASCFSPLNMMLALYDFSSFKFVKMCFMAQNMVYIGECSMWTWTEYIMYSVFVVVYKCQIQLIDGTVKFIYILTEFLPARPVNYYYRGAGVYNYNCEFVSPCSFIKFFLTYFDALLLGT